MATMSVFGTTTTTSGDAGRIRLATGTTGRRSTPRPSFLRERIVLFAFLGAAFASLRLGIFSALEGLSAMEAIMGLLTPGPELSNALSVAAFLIVGTLARVLPARLAPPSVLDAVGFILITCGPTWLVMTLGQPMDTSATLVPLLAFSIVALWRAAIVPSHPLTTLVLVLGAGLLAQTPMLLAPESGYLKEEGLSFVVVIALVTMTCSQVIYRLARRARTAEQLGQYRLERRIGGGGMGDVFRASHALMRRPVAIKVLRLEAHDQTSVQRFEREVRLTATLEHPNTISIYDFGQTPEGQFFYVMELLRGLDLERIVQTHGPLPAGRVIHILRQACGALGEAHEKGVIHRDVKPANILLCELGGIHDFVKVLDFGLVKELSTPKDPGLTGEIGILGTPLYMSPEAVRARETIDARSDIYSLGCVAYQLVTGQKVFEGESIIEICSAHLEKKPIRPSERLGAHVPEDLEEIILRCLEKDPQRRPDSMSRLDTALAMCRDAKAWTRVDREGWWQEHMPSTFPSVEGSSAWAPPGEQSFHESFTMDGGTTGQSTQVLKHPPTR